MATKDAPALDASAAYVAEGHKAIQADGTFDPDFWTAFGFTSAQRDATQKRWDRNLWIMGHSEKWFMTGLVTAGGSVEFTIEPSPDIGGAVRRGMFRDFATMMPASALQYLASQGGLAEKDLIFGSFGRNRREYEVTQSDGTLRVHEKQYAYDEAAGWVLVSDITNCFNGIPPRYANLFEQAKR